MSDLSEFLSTLTPEQRDFLLQQLENVHKQHSISSSSISSRITDDMALTLSFSQRRLWFLDQLSPGNAFYNIYRAYRLQGKLHNATFYESLQEIVRRHGSLRTTFPIVDQQPVQMITLESDLPLTVIDLQVYSLRQREDVLTQQMSKAAQRSFNLSQGPLVRFTLWQLGEHEHVFLVTMHHIVCDGWSVDLFFQELSTLYAAFVMGKPSPLVALPLQYTDVVLCQRQQFQQGVQEEHWRYWQLQLGKALPVLELPGQKSRLSEPTLEGSTFHHLLPQSLADQLKLLGRKERVSLFTMLLAAFSVLLHRYTNRDIIPIGTPTACRDQLEFEGMIGCFINVVVLLADVSDNPPFRVLLKRIQQVILEAQAHQDFPFELLVKELYADRDLSIHPFFTVMFTLQNGMKQQLELPGMDISAISLESGTAKFDLTLDMVETREGLMASFEYNTDILAASTITRMSAHLHTLLHNIVADPNQKLSELQLMAETEYRQLVPIWNMEQRVVSAFTCIQQYIEEQAEKAPNTIAIVYSAADIPCTYENRMSYAMLNACANRLARYLRSLGVGPEIRVGVYLERSPALIVALLGILKAGGAYVPLDPSSPTERITWMINDAGVSLVLTLEHLSSQVQGHTLPYVCLDQHQDRIKQESDAPLESSSMGNTLAYIVYTSGSTGRPKGVMVEHRSLINIWLAWERAYQLQGSQYCHLQMASFSFDVFTGDMIRALCSGGKLVICSREILLVPEKLYQLMCQEGVNCAEFVPAVLRFLMRYIGKTQQTLDFMRLLIIGSDTWYVREHKQLRALCGSDTRLIHSYGVSEATIDSVYLEDTALNWPTGDSVPIGKPFEGVQLYVLDRYLCPAPLEVTGELYIGGAGLARGYVQGSDLTAARFIPHPFGENPGERLYRTGDLARVRADGVVELRGRVDQQVKVRGMRVEPGEVEGVLREHPAVKECITTVYQDRYGSRHLVAYIVPVTDFPGPQALSLFLKGKLPEYMIPSMFIHLDDIPLTPNQKVDQRMLLSAAEQAMGELEDTFVAARDSVEANLVTIWEALLDFRPIGVTHHFFLIGGHSLLGAQVINIIQERFHLALPLCTIFHYPTIEQLANVMRQKAQTQC